MTHFFDAPTCAALLGCLGALVYIYFIARSMRRR